MTSDFTVSSIDLFPSILQATGTALPKDRLIDGLSLHDHMISGGKHVPKRDTLLWHFPHYRHAPGPYSIIRKGKWKLIKFWEGIHELYDLENDLEESQNLAKSNPELVKELDRELTDSLKSGGALFPKPNPNYNN